MNGYIQLRMHYVLIDMKDKSGVRVGRRFASKLLNKAISLSANYSLCPFVGISAGQLAQPEHPHTWLHMLIIDAHHLSRFVRISKGEGA